MNILILARSRVDIHQLKKKLSTLNDVNHVYIVDCMGHYTQEQDWLDITKEFDLNAQSDQLRSAYVKRIANINDLFIQSSLVHKQELSYFHLTDVSCKRTEISDVFRWLCEVTLLNELVSRYHVKCMISTDHDNPLLSQLDVPVDYLTHKPSASRFQYWYWWCRFYLSQLHFFISSMVSLLIIKCCTQPNTVKKMKDNNVFLCRFPRHFRVQKSKIREEKYGELIQPDDVLLINLLSDGMHQYLNPRACWKALKQVKQLKHYIILDRYLNFRLLCQVLFIPLKHKKIIRKLSQQSLMISGVDISQVLIKDMLMSIFRYARYVPYLYSLEHLFQYDPPKTFYYYLHEYSYGRVFGYLVGKACPKTKRVGMQHGPASFRKLVCFMDPEEVSQQSISPEKILIPDQVLVEDELSQSVYESGGYQNVCLLEAVPRLDYLKSIVPEKQETLVLVAAGLHDGHFVVEYANQLAAKQPETCFYLKLHPKSNIEQLSKYKRNLSNLILTDQHIKYLLSIVGRVICTYSSVGREAQLLGIEVEVLTMPGMINESALLDHEYA